ncbi:MAG: putative ABC transporter ATP-binding protein [Gemmataceae bacterium]|nr:MAG: putative ABC transporter ATP-binding protein [Gemmataceae bacterium]
MSELAPPASEIVVRVEHLSHAYRPSGWVLEEISFRVQAGECVAVVGPNGAGKTTLFLRLAGLLAGVQGQVNVCGWDPADPRQRVQLPGVLGMVFQNPEDQLFAPSVLEDVAFGPLNLGLPPDVARERALTALAAVGFPADKVHTPPFQLSGGDKRRAALAGVLAMQPKVWLLDEPTAFLDPRGRRELLALLRTLPGAKLIATHDLDFVLELCSRVLLLDGGRLIADGSIEDIFGDAELLERHGLEVPYRWHWLQSMSMRSDVTKKGVSTRCGQATVFRSEEH